MTDAARQEAGHWLPDDARLIALVRDTGSDDWAAGVAIGLADMIGRARGRTYLANVAGRDDQIDTILNAAGGPGLTSALTGAATLGAIARPVPDQKFTFLPAGDAALPYSALARMEAFRRFLSRVKQGGGTVLLYVGEEDLSAPARPRRPTGEPALDGCIALGASGGIPAALGAPLLARVERPAPAPPDDGERAAKAIDAAEPQPAAESGPAPATDGSDAPGVAFGSLLRLLAPLAVLLVAWAAWALATRDGPADAGPTTGPLEIDAPTDADDAAAGALAAGADLAEEAYAAPPARYSILVGSYIRLIDALDRREELARDGGLFFVAPTPVRGRMYYRVLAGVHEDRTDAVAAMSALVEDGRKEGMKEWDVRPVRLAFDLGTFESSDDAARRVGRLLTVDVPAYVLRDTLDPPNYRVYSGAFTSEQDAEPLGRTLTERQLGASLEPRVGIAP